MPQLLLPFFPDGATYITPELSFAKEKGTVAYFHGLLPVFSHDEDDTRTFQMIISQFVCNGCAKQADIVRAFGVTSIGVKRAVKRYREQGPSGFYAKRIGRGPAVLTEPVLLKAQRLFDDGMDVPGVAEELGLKSNTLAKAVRAGRLHVKKRRQSGK